MHTISRMTLKYKLFTKADITANIIRAAKTVGKIELSEILTQAELLAKVISTAN